MIRSFYFIRNNNNTVRCGNRVFDIRNRVIRHYSRTNGDMPSLKKEFPVSEGSSLDRRLFACARRFFTSSHQPTMSQTLVVKDKQETSTKKKLSASTVRKALLAAVILEALPAPEQK